MIVHESSDPILPLGLPRDFLRRMGLQEWMSFLEGLGKMDG